MSLTIDSVSQSGLDLSVSGDKVIAKGIIDCEDPSSFLGPFLLTVHDQACSNGIHEIQVDFTDLKFLNSAGLCEFTDWIAKLEEIPEDKQYDICFFGAPDKHQWQKTTLQTMQLLSSHVKIA